MMTINRPDHSSLIHYTKDPNSKLIGNPDQAGLMEIYSYDYYYGYDQAAECATTGDMFCELEDIYFASFGGFMPFHGFLTTTTKVSEKNDIRDRI